MKKGALSPFFAKAKKGALRLFFNLVTKEQWKWQRSVQDW